MIISNLNWKRLLKFFGPLLFVFLFIRVVDPWRAAELLKGIRQDLVIWSLTLFPVIMIVRTLRWWVISRPLDLETSFIRLFQINYISWFLGNLPMSGISVISKIIYLKEENTPAGKTFISVTLDKLFDVIGLMLFGLYGLFYFPAGLVGDNILWMLGGMITLVVIIMLAFGKNIWGGIRELLNRYLNTKIQRIGNYIETDIKLFWSRFDLRLFSTIMGLSICLGLLRSLVLYVLAQSLGMNANFELVVGCRALIGIANIIPVSVSGLGTRDAILLLTLPIAGYSKEAALALGITVFLWTTAFKFSGVLFWLKRPLPYSAIVTIKEKIFS